MRKPHKDMMTLKNFRSERVEDENAGHEHVRLLKRFLRLLDQQEIPAEYLKSKKGNVHRKMQSWIYKAGKS